ncbi:MAG: hypothetical protein FRX49_07871 [Trebouxia sp. A1-2]|nr:MAG: hypothetical protein FRX49_07871 [Trebouxia sp. A1-2]
MKKDTIWHAPRGSHEDLSHKSRMIDGHELHLGLPTHQQLQGFSLSPVNDESDDDAEEDVGEIDSGDEDDDDAVALDEQAAAHSAHGSIAEDEGTDAAGQQILDADPASRSISPAAERSNAVVDSKAVSKDMPPTTLVSFDSCQHLRETVVADAEYQEA